MDKNKLNFILISVGLFVTFVCFLYLPFAINLSVPEYRANGMQLMTMRAPFFRDMSFLVDLVAFLVFAPSAVVMIVAMGLSSAMAVNPSGGLVRRKNLLLAGPIVAILLVPLAFVTIVISKMMYP